MDKDDALDVTVRALRAEDCDRLTAMDRDLTGRSRRRWYEGKLKRALTDSDIRISLGAEVDGTLVGAVMASLDYGEFGRPEPVAVLDTVLVDAARRRHGVGRALLAQLVKNLKGLAIERVRTEVDWDDRELIGFFARAGFSPVPCLVLELDVARAETALDQALAEAEGRGRASS